MKMMVEELSSVMSSYYGNIQEGYLKAEPRDVERESGWREKTLTGNFSEDFHY